MNHNFHAVTALLLLAALPQALRAQDPADAAWAAGEHDRARELYAQRVTADSNDVRALHRLALLRSWNSEYAPAIQLFDRVLQINPRDTAVAHARARTLSWSGRLGAAEGAYRDLLAADPADTEARRGLARVASWRGDLGAGEDLWRQVIAADPGDVDARVGLSQVLRWRGQPSAALEEARRAVQLAPQNRDAQQQLAWAEAAFATRIAPSVSAEFDSDDNRLITTSLAATAYLSHRLAVTASGYLRNAEDNRPALGDLETRAFSLGLRAEVGAGWLLGLTGGVTDRQVAGADPTGTFAGSVASPSWLPVSAQISVSRSVLDATALLMETGIEIDQANLTMNGQAGAGLRIDGGIGFARFRGVTENDRLLARVGVDAGVGRWLRLRPRATVFWFDDQVNEGYFNPDLYMLGELGLGLDRYRGAWAFNAEVAPGLQQIGSQDEFKGAVSARLRVGYSLGPGRDIGISFGMSNLGIERLQANRAGYRYQAAVISAAWGF